MVHNKGSHGVGGSQCAYANASTRMSEASVVLFFAKGGDGQSIPSPM